MGLPPRLAPHLPPAHRRALAAAARVACVASVLSASAAVVACGPKAPAEPEGAAASPAHADPTDLTCAKAIPDEGSALTEADKECCTQLVAHQETLADPMAAADFPQRGVCCGVLGWPGGMACTPWGPPTPPAMA